MPAAKAAPSAEPGWSTTGSSTRPVASATICFQSREDAPPFVTRAAAVPAGFAGDVEAWSGSGDAPIGWILERLAARGVERLLVEAGGDLLFQFLAADALDEMYVTLCPIVVGGNAPTLADGLGFDRADVRTLRLLDSEVAGDEIFLHYRVEGRAAA